MSFIVSVTYGNTIPHARFASGIKRREDAERLKELAIALGYDDAEVLSAEEYRQVFAARQGGQTNQGRPAQRSGKMRDMRTQPPPPVAEQDD
jgi:hypothetical protein